MNHAPEASRDLALAVFAANGRLVSAGNLLVEPLGLTSAWWQVLATLRYAPAPLTVAAIARGMGLTRQAVQRIVDLLAQRDLVTFRPNPQHRRAKLVALTVAGRDAVAEAERAAAPVDRAIVDRIGPARLRDAIATLQAMVAIVSEHLDATDAPLSRKGPSR